MNALLSGAFVLANMYELISPAVLHAHVTCVPSSVALVLANMLPAHIACPHHMCTTAHDCHVVMLLHLKCTIAFAEIYALSLPPE